MPYTRVTRTAFGADAIKYARGTGKGHNGAASRNQIVIGVNMFPDDVVPFEQQMQEYWDRADPRHTNQVNRFIISFSRDELDPDKPDDVMKAADICVQFAREIAPESQSAVFVQTDGESGLVHGHVLVNDVQFTDLKGLAKSARYFPAFSGVANRICESYFDAKAPGEGLAPERVNQNVRHQREANKKIRERNERERQEAEAQNRKAELVQENYIWQDDLRARIKRAAEAAENEKEFARLLREDGVELIPEYDKDGGMSYRRHATKTQPVHYVYELVDTSGFTGKVPKNLKSKSHRLGANYQPDGIAGMFRQKQPTPAPLPQPVAVPAEPATKQPTTFDEIRAMTGAYVEAYLKEHYPHLYKAKQCDFVFNELNIWRRARKRELAKDGKKLPAIVITDEDGQASLVPGELDRELGIVVPDAQLLLRQQEIGRRGFDKIAQAKDDRDFGDG